MTWLGLQRKIKSSLELNTCGFWLYIFIIKKVNNNYVCGEDQIFLFRKLFQIVIHEKILITNKLKKSKKKYFVINKEKKIDHFYSVSFR